MTSSRHRQIRRRIREKTWPEIGRIFQAGDHINFFRYWLANLISPPVLSRDLLPLPLKSTRLDQLCNAGLNCAPYQYWMRGELDEHELRNFLRQYNKVSFRTFTEEKYGADSPKLPVEYGISNWERLQDLCRINNHNYHILINQFLPLDCIYAGNIILEKDHFIFSSLRGFGTPRMADEQGAKLEVFRRRFDEPVPEWAPGFLSTLKEQFRSIVPTLRPITLEFSYFPYAVGLLQKQEVFWEWRGGSVHDLARISQYLLSQQAKSYEATIQLS